MLIILFLHFFPLRPFCFYNLLVLTLSCRNSCQGFVQASIRKEKKLNIPIKHLHYWKSSSTIVIITALSYEANIDADHAKEHFQLNPSP